jgi:hypothetical protein
MQDTTTSPGAQILRGLVFVGFAAFFVRTDVINNLNHFTSINPQFAHIAAASALLIVILPWRGWQGALKAICLLAAAWAGWMTYAGSMNAATAESMEITRQKAVKIQDAKLARDRLATITETGDTEALRQITLAAKRTADEQTVTAETAVGERGACQRVTRCKAAAETYTKALERQSQAEARDTYRAQIIDADSQGDKVATARTDAMSSEGAMVIAAIFVMICQGGALLGYSGLEDIYIGFGRIFAQEQEQEQEQEQRLTKDKALRIIRAHIDRCGGEVVASQSQIAKLFPGVPRTTVCGARGWLAQWIATGDLYGEANVWRTAKRKAA